jgi:hypothetical protein
VTRGATVSFRYTWHNRVDEVLLLDNWAQWENTRSDGFQDWRDSTYAFPVAMRYAIVITPFLMLWYFLLVNYSQDSSSSSDVDSLPMCIFVLLPSSLLFFATGAWLPLAGAVLCGIAVQVPIGVAAHVVLLFLAFVCNLVHGVACVVIFSEFGLNTFMHADTIRMLPSHVGAFMSGSPSWITLTLPCTVAVNCCFCFGTGVCIWMEYKRFGIKAIFF